MAMSQGRIPSHEKTTPSSVRDRCVTAKTGKNTAARSRKHHHPAARRPKRDVTHTRTRRYRNRHAFIARLSTRTAAVHLKRSPNAAFPHTLRKAPLLHLFLLDELHNAQPVVREKAVPARAHGVGDVALVEEVARHGVTVAGDGLRAFV